MCTTFPFAETLSNDKVWLGASEQPFAQGRLSTSKCDLSACAVNLLIFLFGCAAYGLLFKRTRALRSNSVFKAIAMLAKPAKICQRSARTSGEICTLIVEGDSSVQIGCSTLLARLLLKGVPDRRKAQLNTLKTCIIYENVGVFHMTATRPGGIPLHRHLEKFSQIFRA